MRSAGRVPGAGMGLLLRVGAMLAIGQPVGAPAGEAVGVCVVLVGTIIEEQAEAGAVENECLDLHTQQLTTTTLIGYFYNDVIHRIVAHVARTQLGTGHLSRGGRQRVAQVEPMGSRILVEVSTGHAGQ